MKVRIAKIYTNLKQRRVSSTPFFMKQNLVAATGIEPVTLGLWVLRSNQLSYAATRLVNFSKFNSKSQKVKVAL